MKKQLIKAFCLLIGLLAFQYSYSQNNIDEIIRDKSNNYFTIKQKATEYFNRVGTVGTGYKQYKRWEFLVKNNVTLTGEIPNFEENNKLALSTYQASNTGRTLLGNSNWTPLGQDNPTILPGNGQNGMGSIRSIEFAGSDIWVGTPGGGIWKADFVSGSNYNWSSTTDGIPNLAVQDVVIAPSNSSIMYAVTGAVGSASGYRSTGVLKSTNSGATWFQTGLTFLESGSEKGFKLLMHPTNSNIVWAATTLGLYRTTDGGITWNLVTFSTTIGGAQNNFTSDCYDIEWVPGSSTIMYATSASSYFYKSTDGGVTFLRIDRTAAGLPTSSGRNEIGVSAANTNYIYLLYADAGSAYQGLYLSTNSGTSFTLQSTTPNIIGSQGWRNICIEVSPTDATDVYVGGLHVYKSTNSGVVFTQVSSGASATTFCHADIFDLYCDVTYLYAATDGGLYRMTRSTDSWVSLNKDMQISQNYRIGIDPTASDAFVIGGTQDNGTYKNTGILYTNIGGGDGMEAIVKPSNTNVIYLSTQNGDFYRSDDGGVTNTYIRGGSGNWTTPAALRTGFDTHIYIGYVNIDYNTNSGAPGSWNSIATGFGSSIESLEFAPSNSTVMYATDGTTIKKFTLSGGVWTPVTINGNLPVLSNITEIAIDPTISNHVVITCGGYSSTQKVFETFNASDGTTTWTSIVRNLPNVPVNCVVIDDDANNTIYIGTDIGVFVKNDVTFNWIMYSNDLPITRVYDLEINYNLGTNRLYAATFGRGIFYTSVYTGCVATAILTGAITGLNYTEVSSTISSSQVLKGDAGTSVAYQAGSSITLQDGFRAPTGIKKFQAYIGGCTTNGNPPNPLRTNSNDNTTNALKPNAEGEIILPTNKSGASKKVNSIDSNKYPEGDVQNMPTPKKVITTPQNNNKPNPQGGN
jgi:hypothetical protein